MINKKIVICVGTDRLRCLRIRLSLLLIDSSSGEVISEQFHSASLSPGDNPTNLRTVLDAHLTNPAGGIPGAPWPSIPDSEWAEVLGHVTVAHTVERIAEYRALLTSQQL